MPKISVLIPVFNTESYIKEALDSILNQSLQDFEIIIIDDGCTDNTIGIIKNMNSDKIKVVRNPKKGIASALNYGISLAQGEYIARMDGDDISLPHRFERQIDFLNNHQDITIVGSYTEVFSGDKSFLSAHPTGPKEIRSMLLLCNIMAHPTIMFRKSLCDVHGIYYDEIMTNAQDFDLWKRASRIVNLANIPEVLLKYRQHSAQVGHAVTVEGISVTQRNTWHLIQRDIKDIFGIIFPETAFFTLYGAYHLCTKEDFIEFIKMLRLLVDKIQQSSQYDEKIVINYLVKLFCLDLYLHYCAIQNDFWFCFGQASRYNKIKMLAQFIFKKITFRK